MYQGESSTSQLGWHPEKTLILYCQTQQVLLKNRKWYIQDRGLTKTLNKKVEAKIMRNI